MKNRFFYSLGDFTLEDWDKVWFKIYSGKQEVPVLPEVFDRLKFSREEENTIDEAQLDEICFLNKKYLLAKTPTQSLAPLEPKRF